MNILLETSRLLVKPTTLANFEEVYPLLSDPEIMRYVGRGVKTREEARDSLEKMIRHQEKHGFSMGCVYEKETGALVGRAGLVYWELNDTQAEIEVGYLLSKPYWKKGYGTELAKAFVSWGFKNLKVNKLIAVLCPENEASRRVLEKVGMHYVGIVSSYGAELAKYEIFHETLDDKKLALEVASREAYPLIQNMGRFYVYDISEYLGHEHQFKLPRDGLYECIDFKKYWEDSESFPFLVHYDKEVAGFAIVDKKGSEPGVDFNMAQFFILRKFQGKGLGRLAAYRCFNRFPGVWEVMVMPRNEGAYRFWRTIIKGYTHNQFSEVTRPITHLRKEPKNIFKFDSRKLK
jgi:ribosomal-protein-alanine N-acetyltransferase